MVYELAVDVTYCNSISNKWQVKVLGFKVFMQSVNHYSWPVQMRSHLGIPLRDVPDFSSKIPSFPISSSGS